MLLAHSTQSLVDPAQEVVVALAVVEALPHHKNALLLPSAVCAEQCSMHLACWLIATREAVSLALGILSNARRQGQFEACGCTSFERQEAGVVTAMQLVTIGRDEADHACSHARACWY